MTSNFKGLAEREQAGAAKKPDDLPIIDKLRWQKLTAMSIGLLVLFMPVVVIKFVDIGLAGKIADIFTAYAAAVTTITTGYIGGNVLEHFTKKAQDKIRKTVK